MGLYPDELKKVLSDLGEKPFRAGQVFAWLHKGARFEEMTNLSLSLREKLDAHGVDQPVAIRESRVSKLDGTEKFLFALRDGNCIEGVLMRYHYGATLCISTQVGCRMGCKFCASTLEGCVRNLTAAEMLGQVQCANRQLNGERLDLGLAAEFSAQPCQVLGAPKLLGAAAGADVGGVRKNPVNLLNVHGYTSII